MIQRDFVVRVLSLVAFTVAASIGCNGILGNEEGKPRVANPSVDAGPSGDAQAQAQAPRCEATNGDKLCYGLCVKIDKVTTGCGGASCTACDPKNVVAATCKGGTDTLVCGYDACKPTFESCDGQDANGCETSLNRKDSCGDCNTKCTGGTPLCAPTDATHFACAATCPGGTQECSGSCVDTMTSAEHCGQCGLKCERASAKATCRAGKCEYECQAGTHPCGDACVLDVDPNFCGPQCLRCAAEAPNTVATCQLGSCATTCAPGFIDCNGKKGDGCEFEGNSCPIVNPCDGVACKRFEICCNGTCAPETSLCPVIQ